MAASKRLFHFQKGRSKKRWDSNHRQLHVTWLGGVTWYRQDRSMRGRNWSRLCCKHKNSTALLPQSAAKRISSSQASAWYQTRSDYQSSDTVTQTVHTSPFNTLILNISRRMFIFTTDVIIIFLFMNTKFGFKNIFYQSANPNNAEQETQPL